MRACGAVYSSTAPKKYDPRAMIGNPYLHIPWDQRGRPSEIVLHIAGEVYYPTRNGYVRLPAPPKPSPQGQ